jgi:cytochrome c-type biogenesis protein CcmH/NrfG
MVLDITLGNILTMVVILVGAAVSWGVAKQRLDDHETRIKQHDGQLDAVSNCQFDIKVKLAEIARDILHIRERLDKEGR